MNTPEAEPSIPEQSDRWNRIAVTVLHETLLNLEIKQKELASRIGWTSPMIVNLLHGRKALQLSDFLLIASALNVDAGILLQRIRSREAPHHTVHKAPLEHAALRGDMDAKFPTRPRASGITWIKTVDITSADIPHEAVKRAFADVLCCLRHQVSLSQGSLAKDTQIYRGSVACMERGRSEPTLGMLFRLSPGLQATPDHMVAMTAARLCAMQHNAFDPSASPRFREPADFAIPRSLEAALDIRKLCLAVAMVVRALRLRARYKQRRYAKAAGIDYSYEIQIEHGKINPTLTTVLRLSAAAGLPGDFVVEGVQRLVRADLKEPVLNQWLQSISLHPREGGRPPLIAVCSQ